MNMTVLALEELTEERRRNRWFRCVGAEGKTQVKGIGSFCGRVLEVVREGLLGDAMAVGVEKIYGVGGKAGFPNWRLDYRSLQGQGYRNVLQSDLGVTSFFNLSVGSTSKIKCKLKSSKAARFRGKNQVAITAALPRDSYASWNGEGEKRMLSDSGKQFSLEENKPRTCDSLLFP